MKLKRLLNTIGLTLRRSAPARGAYLRKKHIMASVGEKVSYQPRIVPLYPELIKLHNNIVIGAGVRLITHDAAFSMINRMGVGRYPEKVGCIEIMNNVFIGYNCTILPNVRIGNNVIVGASSTVTKDLPDGGVYVGIPAKRICSFDDFLKKYAPGKNGEVNYSHVLHNQMISQEEINNVWNRFEEERICPADES